ncbi:sigma-70 family RNA polymerase sigma factor [Nucisporomicrobium flavum]|uniref:sigma-70 family RNA polymerase sigma factor n=1 Tax=Nucisporomicrobium flavum TaxID=2785915 RepID=UPI0018F4DF36|nr:sigma-70 family RNA polymerase sigma factor [Nucisporomicrobium flavum]
MAQPTHAREEAVVVAARAGDRAAWDELARRHLPMVYALVRQALHDDPGVDDVVQDVMVRALRQLSDLRSPGSFRPWLAAIAVRQIGSHLSREDLAARRSVPLDEVAGRPDAGAEVEGPAVLRTELAGQRRQVGHATRWMGAEERTVYSLWWLEAVGELTRRDVAAALGTSVAHAGVRIQRTREQLEAARRVVAALEAMPGCDVLGDVAAEWDGVPSGYWRKRLTRHVESCRVCGAASGGLIPLDRLLAGIALLPVPVALTAAVAGKTFPSGAVLSSWLGRIVQVAVAHPLAATVASGMLVVGVTASATAVVPLTRSSVAAARALPRPGPPQPDPPAGALRAGRVSLESATSAGRFVAVTGDQGVLATIGPGSDAATRERTTLMAEPGLADASCFSFRRPDGRYLRHSSFRLRLSADEGTVLFRRDATFCGRDGFVADSVALESFNYRGFFLRHVGDQLWIDQFDGSDAFRADGSFRVRPPR